MASETTKPDPSLDDGQDKSMQKHLDREIKEMISALTNRLVKLQHVQKLAGGSSHHDHEEENDQGVRIITLAGNNVGAIMRGEMDEKTTNVGPLSMGEHDDALSTYVNSNFQAINNSIMMDGSYSTNDPGVHMDISDYMEDQMPQPFPTADTKHRKKGKKKHTGSSSSKSNQETGNSE